MKKILSGLMAAALTLCLLPAAHAAQPSLEEMAQILSALNIMTGNEKGDLMLSRSVTRAEFTKLTIAASPLGDHVGASTTVSPYPDVPRTHWAAPYVEAAVSAGYVNGYLDGTFHPDENVTLAAGVTMVVRLLGYSDADFSGAWPTGQMTLYHNLDLDEGISIGQNSAMTRQDALCLFYNLLTARTKSGQVYLTTLGHTLTPSGDIDRVSLINSAMDGPVVVTGDWQSKVNFDLASATIYRGGNQVSLSALQPNDVIYFSSSMRTVWAYSNKVTGIYQGAEPNSSNPSSVTVAGRKYAIESPSAAYTLSNLGPYRTGDTVTLLLGRDGGVAAVAASASAIGTVYGVVSAVTNNPYTDANGNAYTAKTVTISATDGNTYSYPVDAKSTLKEGNLVQVTSSGGSAQVKALSQSSTSGTVNAAGTRLGSTPLADDVQILDYNDKGQAVKLYPSRLANMSLRESNVKFFRKNSAGQINILILNDFTGDLYSYGVLTSAQEMDSPAGLAGFYQYDVGGVPYYYTKSGGIFTVSPGPVKIEGSLQAPDSMRPLTSVSLTSVDASSAVTTNNSTFPVWSSVAVYELENGGYRLSSLERVRVGYSLTGYYDKSVANGGCIRVIVARPTA